MSRLLLVVVFFGLWLPLQGIASSQFYFIAKPGALGAASKLGQEQGAVHLRWDILEGALPEDIEEIRLTKDGEVLGQWPVTGYKDDAEIVQIFSEQGQQQRLLQLITMLKELSLSEMQHELVSDALDFDVSAYGQELIRRLDQDVFWSHFASRQNVNIARVRNRAYLDRDIEKGRQYEYRLYAIGEGKKDALIGKTTVNTGEEHSVLKVRNLRQLPIADSCDSTKDHFTVALDWLAAGETITDRASNNIQLAGYEIYRSMVDQGNSPVERDFAAEAKVLLHNGRGEIVFEGLEKVNDTLLMLDGDGTDTPEFIEARDRLSFAGLRPGDRRTYYVVGRDFAGHYGESESVVVQIPRSLPPVTPWNIESAYNSMPEGGIQLSWDSVNVKNFVAHNPDIAVCNKSDAAQTGFVEFTRTEQQQCERAFTARVDIEGYQLYRFNTFSEARGFKDSDGDGVSDAKEYAEKSQCNGSIHPLGESDYRVLDPQIADQSGTVERKVFTDQDSDLMVGSYYWYRIASYTADGKYSLPSRPIRVLVPDLTAPPSPSVNVTRTVAGNCCQIDEINRSQPNWSFTDSVGGGSIVLLEGDNQSGGMNPEDFGSPVSRLCLSPGQMDSFWGVRGLDDVLRQLVYSKDKKDINKAYCEVDIPAGMDICKSGAWQLSQKACVEEEAVESGDVIEGPVTVTLRAIDDESCLEYYDTIAGRNTLLHTSCGTDTPGTLIFGVEHGFVCGTAVARDPSSNTSAPADVPCTLAIDNNPLSPPQILSLAVEDETLRFSWRTPLQLTASTLIEIRSDVSSSDTQILSFANDGLESGRFFSDQSTNIHALLDGRDQWCIRAIAIGAQVEGGGSLFRVE